MRAIRIVSVVLGLVLATICVYAVGKLQQALVEPVPVLAHGYSFAIIAVLTAFATGVALTAAAVGREPYVEWEPRIPERRRGGEREAMG